MVVKGWQLFFCLPGFVAVLALGTEWQGALLIAGIGLGLAMLILMGRTAKWPALIAMWLIWMAAGLVTFTVWPQWVVAILSLGLVWLASFAATRIGRDWGQSRAARLRAKGRGIREWEWVFTGSGYVRAHPLNRLSWGLYASAAALGLSTALSVLAALAGASPLRQIVLAIIFALPIWPILARQPVAYPLVILAFVAALATQSALTILLLPVLMYWVDGVRPNLIYRHRFERLLPGERTNEGTHVS